VHYATGRCWSSPPPPPEPDVTCRGEELKGEDGESHGSAAVAAAMKDLPPWLSSAWSEVTKGASPRACQRGETFFVPGLLAKDTAEVILRLVEAGTGHMHAVGSLLAMLARRGGHSECTQLRAATVQADAAGVMAPWQDGWDVVSSLDVSGCAVHVGPAHCFRSREWPYASSVLHLHTL
jgi:hypothetical protein